MAGETKSAPATTRDKSSSALYFEDKGIPPNTATAPNSSVGVASGPYPYGEAVQVRALPVPPPRWAAVPQYRQTWVNLHCFSEHDPAFHL